MRKVFGSVKTFEPVWKPFVVPGPLHRNVIGGKNSVRNLPIIQKDYFAMRNYRKNMNPQNIRPFVLV